jgi:hypothetical protein
MAFRLAELFVEITLKGIAGFSQGLSNVHNQLKAIESGARAVGDVGTKAFAAMSVALGGWLRAGFSATAQGNLLALQFTLLHREIASLFLPEIIKLTEALTRLVNWFHRLTGAQQDNIKRWIEGALVAAGVAIVLPKVIAGIAAMVAGVQTLTAALFGLGVASGGVLPAIGAIITAVTALAIGTAVGRQGIGSFLETFRPAFTEASKAISQLTSDLAPLLRGMEIMGNVLAKELASSLRELIPLFSELTKELVPLLKLIVGFVAVTTVATIRGFTAALKELLPVLSSIARFFGVIIDKVGLLPKEIAPTVAIPDTSTTASRRDVTPVGGQFEDVQATFRRLQSAALKLDAGEKSEAQKQLEETRQQTQKLEEIKMAIFNLAPAFTL